MDKFTTKVLLFTLTILAFNNIFVDIVSAKQERVLQPRSIFELKTQGIKAYHDGKYQQAISIWLDLIKDHKLQNKNKAEIYCYIAETYQKIGSTSKAIASWEQAIAIYRDLNQPDSSRLLASGLMDLAQAHNNLNQTNYAKPLLSEAIKIATQENLSKIVAVGYQALGNATQIDDNWQEAILNYKKSLAIAKQIKDSKLTIVALNNLSNVYSLKYHQLISEAAIAQEFGNTKKTDILSKKSSLIKEQAWKHAVQAVKLSKNETTLQAIEAEFNLVKLTKKFTEKKLSREFLANIQNKLNLIPDSQKKAQAFIELGRIQPNNIIPLNLALEVALNIGDAKSQSLALGYLGHHYEQQQNYHKALKLTNHAREITSRINAPEILYRWDWQAGRLLSKLNESKDAQIAYQQAINSLQSIRNFIALDDTHFIDFRKEIEPVYRQLIELLIKENSDENLAQVLETKQLLQLSELENFFGEDCLIFSDNLLAKDNLSKNITEIHTLILEQNTYLIARFPNGQLKKYLLPISSDEITQLIKEWRYDLENQENEKYLLLSQKLYQLLINPLEQELNHTNTQKIVFINDGIFRNVPMGALRNEKEFLIEKYAVSISLGFDIKFNNTSNPKANILAFGLAEKTSNLPALPYVREEISKLKTDFNSDNYLNTQFNLNNLTKKITNNKYNVIHIATHGKFAGTIEQTYLQAYQEKINLKQFEKILEQRDTRKKIDLLTLTACDTAIGNDRAVLGLAGVGIMGNVDNVLGTLWSISDSEIIILISAFYDYWLNQNLTKSEALRAAQIEILKDLDFHPAIWSSLILIES